MRRSFTHDLTLAAMVAALYALLSYFGDIFGLSFGHVQIRFAEALTVLPFLSPPPPPGWPSAASSPTCCPLTGRWT